jgi:hypothetical protein
MKSNNSIIFEGVIQGDLFSIVEGEEQRCAVMVWSRHTVVREGEDDLVVLDDDVRVEFRSAELIEAAWKRASPGREVKVVGAIHRSKADNEVYILAEHAEYRPLLKKEG